MPAPVGSGRRRGGNPRNPCRRKPWRPASASAWSISTSWRAIPTGSRWTGCFARSAPRCGKQAPARRSGTSISTIRWPSPSPRCCWASAHRRALGKKLASAWPGCSLRTGGPCKPARWPGRCSARRRRMSRGEYFGEHRAARRTVRLQLGQNGYSEGLARP